MIDKSKTIEYMLINEKARYEAIKAVSACIQHIFITIIICFTLIACAYMYFVVPVEQIEIDNGSNAVIEVTLDKGSNIWQQNANVVAVVAVVVKNKNHVGNKKI